MGATSAGLLMFKVSARGVVEVLLAHPGGPFWARRDEGAWSVPKGEYDPGEDPRDAAYREFGEETGLVPPPGETFSLGEHVQPGGKRVAVWALEGDLDPAEARSNTFELEWPRGSGRVRAFPEVDRLEWMTVARAREKLLKGQVPFLDDLLGVLRAAGRTTGQAAEGSPGHPGGD
ncbi:MAG TPA: NUDIX domain-containing protein [Acidimicrobiales bacterium]|nr:NUDIX domain-containing protein [Acidimicrobiales bacterium]